MWPFREKVDFFWDYSSARKIARASDVSSLKMLATHMYSQNNYRELSQIGFRIWDLTGDIPDGIYESVRMYQKRPERTSLTEIAYFNAVVEKLLGDGSHSKAVSWIAMALDSLPEIQPSQVERWEGQLRTLAPKASLGYVSSLGLGHLRRLGVYQLLKPY
jgi:hypothetical protein